MNELAWLLPAHVAVGVFGLWVSELKPRHALLDAVSLVSGSVNFGYAVAEAVVLVVSR